MNGTKEKLASLLGYVEEIALLSERPVFSVRNYRMTTFEHQLHGRIGIHHDVADPDGAVWIKIDRLQRTDPPNPDEEIKDWLTISRDPNVSPDISEDLLLTMRREEAASLVSDGKVDDEDVMNSPQDDEDFVDVRLRLDRQPKLQDKIETYIANPWQRWANKEKPRCETISIYDKFFNVFQTIEAEGAENPTEVVFGIGMALWRTEEKTIEHPLIEAFVEIGIDPQSQAILIRPRETDAQLHLKPFEDLENPGVVSLRQAAERHFSELARHADVNSQDPIDLSPFVRRSFEPLLHQAATFLSSSGTYYPQVASDPNDRTLPKPGETLLITDTWAIYARARSSNIIIQDIKRLKDVVDLTAEEALPPICKGFVSSPSEKKEPTRDAYHFGEIGSGTGGETFNPIGSDEDSEEDDVLFPKPFNDPQKEIIRRLNHADGLVVQGPPGTGKTHTIANIICHYLATGRNVLVISKGEPALRVLRDQIPAEVRDLTISLLTNERQGLKQLEKAVTFMANEVANKNPRSIERDRTECEERIVELRQKISSIDAEVFAWAKKQLQPVAEKLSDNQGQFPAQLASIVANNKDQHTWLADELGSEDKFDPQFSHEDINVIKRARTRLGKDLQYIGCNLLHPNDLPDTASICAIHDSLVRADRLRQIAKEKNFQRISIRADESIARTEQLLEELKGLAHIHETFKDNNWLWQLYATWLSKGIEGEGTSIFLKLLPVMERLAKTRNLFLERPVQCPNFQDFRNDIVKAVIRAAKGERPFPLVSIGKKEAKSLFENIRLIGQVPVTTSDWEHVSDYFGYEVDLKSFRERWNALAEDFNLPIVNKDDAHQLGLWLAHTWKLIHRAYSFVKHDQQRIKEEIRALAVDIDAGEIVWKADKLAHLIDSLEACISLKKLSDARSKKEDALKKLASCNGPVVRGIQEFIHDVLGKDKKSSNEVADAWRGLIGELNRIRELRPALDEVERVTKLIEASGAPMWAASLKNNPVTGGADSWSREDWRKTWNFRRLEAYLKKIDCREKLQVLAKNRLILEKRLAKAMTLAVQLRTYRGLQKRLDGPRLSALTRYIAAIRRIGAGTGIRARRYRGDARKAMQDCLGAVPCWIMPTWRVSETLPPELGAFDLVIVDEASQEDARAIPALIRGNKLLVVGDDRQVSPTAVGLEERKLLQLRNSHLRDQPFADMLMPGSSLYDLCKAVFPGGSVLLNEHFRCVEPIIRFSFKFYSEKIMPVRLPTASERLDPPLIDVYVPHGERDTRRKINKAEAVAIVDEIEALVEDPAYKSRSIGVVSLIGDKQAHLIQNLLIDRIGEDRFIHHDIACGDSATFQGKERDIMFLSMVASPGKAQAQTSLLYAQRFNVALSRAKDRMYLFRSVEPQHVPNPEDLKRKVIEHFQNPMPIANPDANELIDLCDSDFERDVFLRLSKMGYRVTPQVTVGEFRIDLVIEGEEDRRLGVELDGDRFHGPDRWFEDWTRQKVLERVGWRIWRCWASSFGMDPDGCMANLVALLDEMEIQPIGGESGRHPYTEHRTVGEETDRPEEDFSIGSEEIQEMVEVGDKIVVSFADSPKSFHCLSLSDSESDPINGIISITEPAGKALLHAVVGDEIIMTWKEKKNTATILKLDKQVRESNVSDMDRKEPGQIKTLFPEHFPVVSVSTGKTVKQQERKTVEVGDTVVYCTSDNPDQQKTVQIVHGPNDPDQGIINKNSPIGYTLLDLGIGDEAEVLLPSGQKTLRVLKIHKLKRDKSDQVSVMTRDTEPQEPPKPANPEPRPNQPQMATRDSLFENEGQSPSKNNTAKSHGLFVEYQNWTPHPLTDPRNDGMFHKVVDGLIEIIEAEGPMYCHRAYHLYAHACGIHKVGRSIRSIFNRAINRGAKIGKLLIDQQDGANAADGYLNCIVRTPDAPEIKLRTGGGRTLEEIPLNEIAALVDIVAKQFSIHEEDQLFRKVLNHYEIRKLTSKARRILESAKEIIPA